MLHRGLASLLGASALAVSCAAVAQTSVQQQYQSAEAAGCRNDSPFTIGKHSSCADQAAGRKAAQEMEAERGAALKGKDQDYTVRSGPKEIPKHSERDVYAASGWRCVAGYVESGDKCIKAKKK